MDVRERPDGVVSPELIDTPSLELRGIVKRFGDVTALSGVDLTVGEGRVHALLGENGAGKSTLMRIAYGLVSADEGEIRLLGKTVLAHSVRDARRAGVGMVHQNLSLVPGLTAAENLVLGGRGQLHAASARSLLEQTARSFGLDVHVDAFVRDLSIVEQQRLEILKALARGARLLILDEPTAVLAPKETEELLRWIRAFAQQGGSVVLVTHKLPEALAVSDDVTVLRRGSVVLSGSAKECSEQTLARAMFETLHSDAISRPSKPGEVVASANGLTISDADGVPRIRDATFELRRHEIVGVAAIEGSGHRLLLSAVAGLSQASAGVLRLPTRVALIPSDRLRDAIIPEFTLTENVALRGAGARRGRLSWDAFAQRTTTLVERFEIVAPSPRTRVEALSGGNQQRLVVARELEHPVDLVVADNPSRGLDIRSTAFVHSQLRDAAARGAAVVIHSPDLDEVLALATRVLVVFHATVREIAFDRDAIGQAMLGLANADQPGAAS